MPAKKNTKKPTKSRTAQTGLKKKVHVPIWAVVVGVLVVAGVGVALVYNSYAGTLIKGSVWCKQGRCSEINRPGHVRQDAVIGLYSQKVCNGQSPYAKYKTTNSGSKVQLQCFGY